MSEQQRIDSYVIEEVECYMPKREDMRPGVMYHSEELKSVKYLCPCGCGYAVHLPLFGEASPRWNLAINGNLPTLSPSILDLYWCHSHYFIREGKVIWC